MMKLIVLATLISIAISNRKHFSQKIKLMSNQIALRFLFSITREMQWCDC